MEIKQDTCTAEQMAHLAHRKSSLEGGAAAATGVPDGDHFKSIATHSVVDPISDAVDMKPPHIGRTCAFDLGPDIWMFEEYIERSFQILADGARSGWSVLSPPPDDTFYLNRSTSSDMKLKGHF